MADCAWGSSDLFIEQFQCGSLFEAARRPWGTSVLYVLSGERAHRSMHGNWLHTTVLPIKELDESGAWQKLNWEKQANPLARFLKRPDMLNLPHSDMLECRGTVSQHRTPVFAYRGKPVTRMLNSSWCRVRKVVGLTQVQVHDLKHTFGRHLRAAGVSFEDRQDLLGHRSGLMTTHYSAPELTKLIESANRVCERDGNRPELVVLRRLNVS